MARVYAVASSKGGVGKTTTTANLSATLAAAGYDVAVVDGDIGMANLGNQLGIAPDGATLHDVLAGEASVEEATYEGPHELAVVPGDTALTAFSSADVTKLGTVLGSFADRDFVFVDTGAGLSHETALPVGLADAVLLVSTADRDALGDTQKTRELATKLGVDVAGAVLNRVTDSDGDTGTLQVEVLGSIPEDETLRKAGNAGIPVTMYDPGSPTAAAYRGVASSIADGPVRPPMADQRTDDTGVSEAVTGDATRSGDGGAQSNDAPEPVEVPADGDAAGDAVQVEPDPESDVSHPDPEPAADTAGGESRSETAADAADADTADESGVVEIDVESGSTETNEDARDSAEPESEAPAETETPADDAAEAIPDAEGDGTGTAEEDEAIPFADSDSDDDAPMVEQEEEDDEETEKKGFLSRLFG